MFVLFFLYTFGHPIKEVMMKHKKLFLFVLLILIFKNYMWADVVNHPCLVLTNNDLSLIRNEAKNHNLLSKSLNEIKLRVDNLYKDTLEVPVPKDAGGGYTHEQHKRNYTIMYEAGILYQVYKDEKYARLIKNTLMKYASMYSTLPLHPVQKSSYRGKLFWQGLNESVWLVYTSQAYDCVYDYLTKQERNYIEKGLFRPMVKFLAVDNEKTFTRIHNHGTWSVAAVGMISYVMGDLKMVEKAISGVDGYVKSGFLSQIDELFSPDGYFVEGPYYQRYSLQPFITFALAIDNREPERKIFEYKDGVLLKAVTTLLQMTEENGKLLYLNDCLEKDWRTTELVWGVDIAYSLTHDKSLLSIAKQQETVMVSKEGLEVSRDIDKAVPFKHYSVNISDGPKGKNGGIGILRMRNGENLTSLVMKYTSQGMGHGHFDKLSYTFYDNNNEVVRDYGAARFLNIEPKNGGHYLKENEKFAKQTIAHNTLVVDQKSHYDGSLKIGSKYSPSFYDYDGEGNIKMISAVDSNSYNSVRMHRTMFMVAIDELASPLVIDLLKVKSKDSHLYDMPVHYNGHLINTNYQYLAYTESRAVLGADNGYQYYWVEALADKSSKVSTTTWLCDDRFYSLSTLTSEGDQIYFTRLGANDPEFNLRPEPCVMHRSHGKDKTFVSVLETHGEYNPQLEYTLNPYCLVSDIQLIYDTDEYTIIKISTKEDFFMTICFSNNDSSKDAEHSVNGWTWKGTYKVFY